MPLMRNLENPEYREWLSSWIASLGFSGLIVFFCFYSLQTVLAVIPSGLIQVIAGAAFGAWGGLFILQAGTVTSAIIIFTIVRKFGNKLIIRFLGEDLINKWEFLENEKNVTLACFILFFIPGLPKDALTYIFAMTKFPIIQFLPISLIARFPAMLSSTLMGDAAIQGNWFLFLLIFAFTAIVGILGIQFRDRIINRFTSKKTI